MINTKRPLTARVKHVGTNLDPKDRMFFIFDLFKGFVLRGKLGLREELGDWEETSELMKNSEYDQRIKNIQDRMARSGF